MKRVISILLCLLTALGCLSVLAFAEEQKTYSAGSFTYALREDDTAEIVAYHGRAKTLAIPDELDGNSVTAIGDEAFAECTELCTVMIPESVTILGYHCFENGADVDVIIEGERAFIDKMLRCEKCGQNFVFSASDQEFYAERGFQKVPSNCPDCRNAQRNQNTTGNTRTFYTANCYLCGKEIQLPFEPKNGRPVYCDECLNLLRG